MVAAGLAPSLARQLDLECVSAAAAHHAAEHALAVLLAQLGRTELAELGYANLMDYGVRRLQLTPRKTRALAAIGRPLHQLPNVAASMAKGQLPWTKAREVLRVATAENEAGWVALAQSVCSRDLETHVGHAALGDRAPEPGAEALAPAHGRLVLQGATSNLQIVRDLVAMLRQSVGSEAGELSDLDLLAMLGQRELHAWKHGDRGGDGGQDRGDPPSIERHTVVLYHCSECRRTVGESCELDDTTVATADCDARVVELRPGTDQGQQTHAIPAHVRRTVLHRDRRRCRVPGCESRLWCDLHHLVGRRQGGTHTPDNLVCLCSAHHTLLHEGRLAVEHIEDVLEVRFADGRVVRVPFDPDAPTMTHVGHAGSSHGGGSGLWTVAATGTSGTGGGRRARRERRRPAPGDPTASDNARAESDLQHRRWALPAPPTALDVRLGRELSTTPDELAVFGRGTPAQSSSGGGTQP